MDEQGVEPPALADRHPRRLANEISDPVGAQEKDKLPNGIDGDHSGVPLLHGAIAYS